MIYDVAIIGGGASGLMAGCVCKEKKLNTIIIEKNSKIGRKILSTGAGKCNISNLNVSADSYLTDDPKKLSNVFNKLTPDKLLSFINHKLGIMTVVKEKGKIFPVSENAASVVNAFDIFLRNKNIEILTLTQAIGVKKEKDFFEIKLKTLPHNFEKKNFKEKNFILKSKKLIISSGGPSYPRIGGSAWGYEILKGFGHSIIDLYPLIVPFKVESPSFKIIDGLRMNAKVTLENGIVIEDEILFTDYGISGPFALELSYYYKDIDMIEIELMSEISEKEMINFFIKREDKNLSAVDFFKSVFDPKFVEFLIHNKIISENQRYSDELARYLVSYIKKFKLYNLSVCGFDLGMSKRGGVSFKEVNENFESTKVKNLFLTGEILNVCGKSGGYNLHFAFTSGYLSGLSI